MERKTFDRLKKGGYDPEQVTAFLAEVGRELEETRGELTRARLKTTDLERRLDAAEQTASSSASTFLVAVEAKQRLLGEATLRAEEILSAAYGTIPELDREAVAERVRKEAGALAQVVADVKVRGEPLGSGAGAQIIAAARTEAARIRAEAESVLADAESLVAQIEAASGSGDATAEAITRAAREEADRIEVRALVDAIEARARADAEAEELINLAKKAAEEMRRESAMAGLTEDDAAEVRVVLEQAQERRREAEARLAEAGVEAARLVSQASSEVERIRAEAESVLTEAGAEAKRVRAAANEAAYALVARTHDVVDSAEEQKSIVTRARDEAEALIETAKAEAERVTQDVRADHTEFTSRLRSLRLLLDDVERRIGAGGVEQEEVRERIVIDLREAEALGDQIRRVLAARAQEQDDADEDEGVPGASRYSQRSAHLPRLGKDAESVIGSMAALRTKNRD